MSTTLVDITGNRYGKLIVVERAGTYKYGEVTWLCQCDCGKQSTVRSSSLRRGDTKSCGCIAAGLARKRLETHGMSKTRLFHIWSMMLERCYRSYNKSYPRYGGRGILICDEWKNNFSSFYEWASSNGYSDALSIDRIDNDKGYYPENCRWTTVKEQANNRSTNNLLSACGRTQTLVQWASERGVQPDTIAHRIKHGWPVKCAIFAPIGGI